MWHAKPKGGYKLGSDEYTDNIKEVYDQLSETWTLEAICGMLGNMFAESGLNPWRWQSDSVSLTSKSKGYGLAQFTPAYGYINNYGKDVEGYAPNLSVSEVKGGSTTDASAQLIVIDTDKAGKFINRKKYCSYVDLTDCYPLETYKQNTDLWKTTVGWLFNYEFPASKYRSASYAKIRYLYAQTAYDILQGYTPDPRPTPVTRKSMPIYMMLRRL